MLRLRFDIAAAALSLCVAFLLHGCSTAAIAGSTLTTDELLAALERHSAPVIEFGLQNYDPALEREVVDQSCVVPYRGTGADSYEYVDYSACCPTGWYVLGLSPGGGVLCREE